MLIQSTKEFQDFVGRLDLTRPVAADVETYKTRPDAPTARLLGLALSGYTKSGELCSSYTPTPYLYPLSILNMFLNGKVIGWNVPFDKLWIDHYLTTSKENVSTNWHADGRILWHLQNNDPMIRGFGLKLAQTKLLGWLKRNDEELEANVKKNGGKLSNGDHYLADLPVLAKYACLDTQSTLQSYEKLVPFIDHFEYWGFAHSILEYSILLSKAATQGLPVSESELLHAAALYVQKREDSRNQIVEVCSEEIRAIESVWKHKKLSTLSTERGRTKFLESTARHRKFNPSSTHQRALLLHTMLEFPVKETTPSGLPKTDRANLGLIKHEAASTLVSYSEYKKVAEQAKTYLQYTEDGRLYTNYDVCGTVSGRLSGFKPSVLNMPFSEPEVMSAFKCESGYVGVHADLAAIEPCVLAHYSDDPSLLKVYKDGRGDIYLDLALSIFPSNLELKEAYDPEKTPSSEVKERFKDVRAVCKIVHLAVSYTGTMVTVAKNLSKNGYPTTRGMAMSLVKSYWEKFATVKAFDSKLQVIYTKRGHIRNIVGRVIQVPDIYKKDLMNRLVQSSAHDILRLWVCKILSEFDSNGVIWRHWLPDLHDSTTFMVKAGQEDLARQCYFNALKLVEEEIGISVPLKCEFKLCTTLAGIKGKE